VRPHPMQTLSSSRQQLRTQGEAGPDGGGERVGNTAP
jgi:hypothetical protein